MILNNFEKHINCTIPIGEQKKNRKKIQISQYDAHLYNIHMEQQIAELKRQNIATFIFCSNCVPSTEHVLSNLSNEQI